MTLDLRLQRFMAEIKTSVIVLWMMYKFLENKDNFEMTGVSEAVREILETTGFDQFFLR